MFLRNKGCDDGEQISIFGYFVFVVGAGIGGDPQILEVLEDDWGYAGGKFFPDIARPFDKVSPIALIEDKKKA